MAHIQNKHIFLKIYTNNLKMDMCYGKNIRLNGTKNLNKSKCKKIPELN